MSYSAADVERYVYCPMSWALSQRGLEGVGAAIVRGGTAHARVGSGISLWRKLLDEHHSALRIALYLALTAATAATLAFEVVFLNFNGPSHWILLLMSLTWLLVALGFLLRAMRKEGAATAVVRANGLVEGELVYSDLDKPGETLKSEKYDLSGRPDYIVRKDGEFIPVEVKTGRTPESPHESHIMQLGVYCILVEEKYGARPTRGVLQYPERTFEVPFTHEFRDRVLETTLKMRWAEMTGEAHRTHNQPGKCLGCSRRDACAERLV